MMVLLLGVLSCASHQVVASSRPPSTADVIQRLKQLLAREGLDDETRAALLLRLGEAFEHRSREVWQADFEAWEAEVEPCFSSTAHCEPRDFSTARAATYHDKAIVVYRELVRRYPHWENADTALYRLGFALYHHPESD